MTAGDDEALDGIRDEIQTHPIKPYADVPETLSELARRHTLFLLTKGQADEQQGKLDRCGLLAFFAESFVVPDKTVEMYASLLTRLSINLENAWMIGNSPRSDINPAAEAGLGTVLIEKERAWDYETVPLKHYGRFHCIRCFGDLLDLF